MASDPPPREGNREPLVRVIVAVVVVGLIVWFALANNQRVEVDFLVASRDARLVFVIVGSAILGALADRLLVWRSRRRHD